MFDPNLAKQMGPFFSFPSPFRRRSRSFSQRPLLLPLRQSQHQVDLLSQDKAYLTREVDALAEEVFQRVPRLRPHLANRGAALADGRVSRALAQAASPSRWSPIS